MDVSFDVLLTPRLVLRRFTSADAAALAAYRSIPEVARFQGWDAPYPVERARVFIAWLAEHHPDEPGEWFQLAIAERAAPDRVIGDCGFRPHADEPLVVDMGYTLHPATQGRGYATEAVREAIRYLFEDRGKHRIAADCDTRNEASWRLLERLGFAREGTLRASFREGDAWADEHLYGLLADEWCRRRAGTAGEG